jgi:hypothetical protein
VSLCLSYVLSVIFAWSPLALMSLLLCFRWDFGVSLPLYKIMTPLWAVDLVALLVPAVAFVASLFRARSVDNR